MIGALIVLSLAGVCVMLMLAASVWAFRRHRPFREESILHAVAVTGFVCAGLVIAAVFLFNVRSRGGVTTPLVAPAAIPQSEIAVAPLLNAPQPVSAPETPTPPSATEPSNQFSPAGSLANSNVVWLPLSEDVLATLLTPEGTSALERLNENVPPELRQAYAMIPLSAPGPKSGPSMLQQTLATSVLRDAVTPRKLAMLANTVAGILLADSPFSSTNVANVTAEAADEETETVESEFEPPTWLDNPGLGRFVVKSDFRDASLPPSEVLKPELMAALQEQISSHVRRQFLSDGNWQKLVDLNVSDDVLSECVVETAPQYQTISTLGTNTRMRKLYALVEFPAAVEDQALDCVRTALKRERALAVCVLVAALWLGALLFSLVCRLSQQRSLLKKLASVPALIILVLPCLIFAGAMSAAIVEGKTFSFRLSPERITCSIDSVSE